jgi:ABC-type antimicrobial peptide transport system permease subunit
LQLVVEISIVTSLGVLIAAVLILQLPLLGALGDIGWSTIIAALCVSMALMYALATASGLYPAWLAARIRPADALHEE